MKKGNILFFLIAFGMANRSVAQDWKQQIDSANSFKSKNNYKEAVDYFIRARQLLKKDSLNTGTYIQSAWAIADCYYAESDFSKAAPFYEEVRALVAAKNSRMHTDYAYISNKLGATYQQSGKLDTAMSLYLEVKEIRKKISGENSLPYAQICNNLGDLYREYGYYDLAEPLLLKAKEIREKAPPAGKFLPYAITCVALGNLYRDLGKYEQAEVSYIMAKNIRRDSVTTAHPLYAASCNILADLYAYTQQYKKAEALYLEAKMLREKKGKSAEYSESCNNLGALYREMGQFAKAEPLLMEAKQLLEAEFPDGHSYCTISYNNLGELYYAMGNYTRSESYFRKARNIWEQELGKDHPYSIANSDEMARLYRNKKEPQKADSLIRDVARLKFKQLNRVFQFTSETEKNLYLKNINGSADEYLSFYYTDFSHQLAGEAYDISVQNRNLVLSSIQQTRQAIFSSGDLSLAGTYGDWTDARQQLARIYSRGAGAETGWLKMLEGKVDRLEKELSRGSAAFKKINTIPGWRDIRDNLQQNETAIEFIEFRVYKKQSWTDSIFYAALITRKDLPEPVLVPLFEKKQLNRLLIVRNARTKQGINLQYTSAAMYKLVWKPLEKYLNGITKIYFAPAGLLHTISLAALATENKKLVSDQYQLVQLLSTASVTKQTQTRLSTADKIVLYGAIQYNADSSSLHQAAMKYGNGALVTRSVPEELIGKEGNRFFEPLPNSEAEIEGIAKAAAEKNINTVSFKRSEANEESVKSLDKEKSAFILHISTHGFFNPDPKTSNQFKTDAVARVFKRSDNPLFRGGIVMAGAENTWRGKAVEGVEDGILTAYEVSNLFFPLNKLVVLSACETALGDIEGSEGVYGLQRAFKMAGAQQLVMSLWKVPDDVTAEFMQLFYRNMFDDLSIDDAFYRAQLVLKNKYSNEPFKWAAWILVR